MDPVIFLEKVRRPDLRGLVRERLERRTAALQRGGDPVSVGLVLGPPGSGKTTLLSHLASTAPAASAWYRIGTEDDDEVALTRHLGHTLGAALGDPALIDAAAGGRILDLLVALDDRPRHPVELIVDDLHEIAGTAAEQALQTFVDLRPRSVTVVLGSRRPPLINTSRLLVSGELVELDGDDLRFRSWEVEQLFRTVYAAPLSPEAAAALTRRTGGWAAGLQLFHLATAAMGRAERERAVDELGGRSRLIRSYLARNVLDGLDRERRRFLLLTATLGVLTGDLCDDLLDASGSAALLSELEREQFFTTSTDGGLTYHYHQVLQTHLEVLLVDEWGGRRARELYARSGQLLEAAGRIGEATRAHARAEDWGSVARLLKPGATPVTGDDALWGMLTLPGVPTDDPGLVLAGARRLARLGQIEAAVGAFRRAEGLLDDPAFRRRCALERQSTALWLPQAPRPAVPLETTSAAVHRSVCLRQLTRQPTGADEPLARALGLVLTGETEAASRALDQLVDGSGWTGLAVRLTRRWIELLAGPDEVSAGAVEEIILEAEVSGWPWLSRIARGLQIAMLVAAVPDDWRVASATELLDSLERRDDPWTLCLTALAVGVGLVHAGRDELAHRVLDRAARLADDLDAPTLRWWALSAELRRPRSSRTPPSRVIDAVTVGAAAVPVEPAAVRLQCLGGFGLAVESRELGWRTLRPRVRSLLMLLALHHGRPLHREQLVDVLWPDATLAAGVRSLQVAVSAIRHCLVAGGLGEEALPRRGDAYALELPGVHDQRSEFERLAHAAGHGTGSTAQALRLAALGEYAGDLLPDLGPAEWVVGERHRLRILAAGVALDAARADEDPRRALELARGSLDLDPYDDSAWELLVDLHIRLGNPSAAAVARRDHARVCADLGLVGS